MRQWAKEVIRKSEFGYLSLKFNDKQQLFPFYYTYDKGRLFSSLTILQADIIVGLATYPVQYIIIQQEDKQVGILARINMNADNLDKGWQVYPSSLHKLTSTEVDLENLPHAQKAVILELIPIRIDAIDKDGTTSTEMEILS